MDKSHPVWIVMNYYDSLFNMFNLLLGLLYLVGGWALPPLKNMSQLGWLFPIDGKVKKVPKHQPDRVVPSISTTLSGLQVLFQCLIWIFLRLIGFVLFALFILDFKTPKRKWKNKTNETIGGFHSHGGTPIAGWLVETPIQLKGPHQSTSSLTVWLPPHGQFEHLNIFHQPWWLAIRRSPWGFYQSCRAVLCYEYSEFGEERCLLD